MSWSNIHTRLHEISCGNDTLGSCNGLTTSSRLLFYGKSFLSFVCWRKKIFWLKCNVRTSALFVMSKMKYESIFYVLYIKPHAELSTMFCLSEILLLRGYFPYAYHFKQQYVFDANRSAGQQQFCIEHWKYSYVLNLFIHISSKCIRSCTYISAGCGNFLLPFSLHDLPLNRCLCVICRVMFIVPRPACLFFCHRLLAYFKLLVS